MIADNSRVALVAACREIHAIRRDLDAAVDRLVADASACRRSLEAAVMENRVRMRIAVVKLARLEIDSQEVMA